MSRTRRETTVDQRTEVWTYYLQGKSLTQIHLLTFIPKSTCSNIITRAKAKTGQDRFTNAKRTGAPKKVTIQAERRLIRAAGKDTKATLAALATPSKSGIQLCRSTVRTILKRNGKGRRRARKKPFLKEEHKKRRLLFRKENINRRWDRVCWSDESTFELGYDGRTVWITRAPGEEYLEKNLKPSFKSGRTSVGVWGCFMGRYRGPLVILGKGARMNQYK